MRFTALLLFTLALLPLTACAGPSTAVADDAATATTAAPATPGDIADDKLVVLELFTSQGCSSCPPADRLLQEMGADAELAEHVLPLSFHVDYWNYIGWTDPFSSKTWSKRQERYARELSGRLYTPQLVVDGTTETVGSKRGEVRKLVDEALRLPAAGSVAVNATPADDALRIRVDAALADSADRDAELVLVVYENELASSVDRGENAGRKLTHTGVVRRLERLGTVEPGGSAQKATAVAWDGDWNRDNVGVAAFLQEPKTLRIVAAGRVR